MASRSSVKRSRPYNSALRLSQADATRRAVLAAACDVFKRLGYAGATIEAVAESAEVSVPTVYARFGSKAGLLSAVLADAGSDPDIRVLASRAVADTVPETRIAAASRVVRTIMQRERAILDVLRQAGAGHPDLEAARRQVHRQQREALAQVLAPLYASNQLRVGISLEDAVATFAALASPESFWFFVDDLGWSAPRWERWLADAAARVLLD